jgi:alcohol dehydrogenase class IV
VRPSVIVNDPALSASQLPDQLAASTANAFGHAVVALTSVCGGPIGAAVAREALRRLVGAWAGPEPARADLALGALLAGWAVDHSGLGLHHVLAQTAVRVAGLGHAAANAALLPASVAALRTRAPGALETVDGELGGRLEDAAVALRRRAGVTGIGRLAGDEALLERAVDAAAERSELDRLPPRPDREELRAIYRAAADEP